MSYEVEVLDPKAFRLLQDLADMNIIVLKEIGDTEKEAHSETKKKLSEKYRNVFTAADARQFNEHTATMRSEWGHSL